MGVKGLLQRTRLLRFLKQTRGVFGKGSHSAPISMREVPTEHQSDRMESQQDTAYQAKRLPAHAQGPGPEPFEESNVARAKPVTVVANDETIHEPKARGVTLQASPPGEDSRERGIKKCGSQESSSPDRVSQRTEDPHAVESESFSTAEVDQLKHHVELLESKLSSMWESIEQRFDQIGITKSNSLRSPTSEKVELLSQDVAKLQEHAGKLTATPKENSDLLKQLTTRLNGVCLAPSLSLSAVIICSVYCVHLIYMLHV